MATVLLYNEAQSRIVISVPPEKIDEATLMLRNEEVPFSVLGKVGCDKLQIQIGDDKFAWQIADLYDDWWNAIRRAVEEEESIPSL